MKKSKKRLLWGSLIGAFAMSAALGYFHFSGNFATKSKAGTSEAPINESMMQYFEWGAVSDGTFWNSLTSDASNLSNLGVTSLWLPPAYKGSSTMDVGYTAYDLYDLGEFNQQGSVRTKYGTKAQYLAAISALHNKDIKVYADIVLNHKGSADSSETVSAVKVSGTNRNSAISSAKTIRAWTKFNFTGRNNKYSSFKWDATCFDGVDYDASSNTNAIYRFANKTWDSGVSTENGNYDYLMFCDIDFGTSKVVNELNTWGAWYTQIADLDGYRLDAVKHISSSFYKQWLTYQRAHSDKDLFSVAEYYSGSLSTLNSYITATGSSTTLFDFPLHYNFRDAANANGSYDLRNLFNNTLVKSNPSMAVTFVDNHDTQAGQSGDYIKGWFKPLAYTAILTRENGIPCTFYGDYYGTGNKLTGTYKYVLNQLLKARKTYAYGKQNDYLDNSNIIGWTREGDSVHPDSGLAALISDSTAAGSKKMYVGTSHAGEVWYDTTGNCNGTVTIDESGYGVFKVSDKSNSVWVKKPASASDSNVIYLYYKYTYPTTYLHYRKGGSAWNGVPGYKLSNSTIAGYLGTKIDLGSMTKATVCFNNGSGTWDNNAEGNYTIPAGTYYIKDGKIYSGKPAAIRTSTSKLTIASIACQSYTGKAIKPSVSVKEGTRTLTSGTDYTLTYTNNTAVGTATVKITGKGNYAGTVSKTFYIVPAKVTSVKVAGASTSALKISWSKVASGAGYKVYRYNTSTKAYTLIKTISGNTTTTYMDSKLTSSTAYSYKVRAYKTISGLSYISGYSDTLATATRPVTPTITSVTAGSKQITVKWGAVARATGYCVYIADSLNGTYTNIGVVKAGTVTLTKTGLTSNKNYYFKVRAYKTVNKTNVFSTSSAAKYTKAK